MNYAYVRVSTEKQTVENQKLVIKEFCNCHRIVKLNWISETISGTKNPEKRKLGELINLVNEGDVVVITELSRLGRSLIMIFNILHIFLEKKVKVIAIKENYELGDNIQSKVIAFAFCVVFYVAAESVRKKIEKEAVERAGEALRGSVEKTIENDIKDALREDLRANMKRLELTEGERAVVSQLAEGKMIKEVEGVSKNTKTDYIEASMLRNGCRTKAELIAIYSLEERLPELFPSLFPEK